MQQSKIEFITPKGTFRGNDGGTMWRHHITFENGVDGLAFTPKSTPWFHVGQMVWFRITGHNNGHDHLQLRRNKPGTKQFIGLPKMATTPGVRLVDEVRTDRWQWAIQTAVIAKNYCGGKMSEYIADVEQHAIQLEMLLERLETK